VFFKKFLLLLRSSRVLVGRFSGYKSNVTEQLKNKEICFCQNWFLGKIKMVRIENI
jgi:hypothetical protein